MLSTPALDSGTPNVQKSGKQHPPHNQVCISCTFGRINWFRILVLQPRLLPPYGHIRSLSVITAEITLLFSTWQDLHSAEKTQGHPTASASGQERKCWLVEGGNNYRHHPLACQLNGTLRPNGNIDVSINCSTPKLRHLTYRYAISTVSSYVRSTPISGRSPFSDNQVMRRLLRMDPNDGTTWNRSICGSPANCAGSRKFHACS